MFGMLCFQICSKFSLYSPYFPAGNGTQLLNLGEFKLSERDSSTFQEDINGCRNISLEFIWSVWSSDEDCRHVLLPKKTLAYIVKLTMLTLAPNNFSYAIPSYILQSALRNTNWLSIVFKRSAGF